MLGEGMICTLTNFMELDWLKLMNDRMMEDGASFQIN